MEHVQRLAHGAQPTQSQRFAGRLLLLFSQKREHAGELAKRRAFNPCHQRDEVVFSPFPGHLEDRGKARVSAEVRAREAVGSQDSPACFRVVPNFGHIGPKVLFVDRSISTTLKVVPTPPEPRRATIR